MKTWQKSHPKNVKQTWLYTKTIKILTDKKYVPSAVLAMRIALFFNKKVEDIFELEEKDYH